MEDLAKPLGHNIQGLDFLASAKTSQKLKGHWCRRSLGVAAPQAVIGRVRNSNDAMSRLPTGHTLVAGWRRDPMGFASLWGGVAALLGP